MSPTKNRYFFTKLVVGDIDKTAPFYKSISSLTESMRFQGISSLDGRPQEELVLVDETGAPKLVLITFFDPPSPRSEIIVGFETKDIHKFVRDAEEAGGTVVKPPYSVSGHGDTIVAFVADPEGHLVEVLQMG